MPCCSSRKPVISADRMNDTSPKSGFDSARTVEEFKESLGSTGGAEDKLEMKTMGEDAVEINMVSSFTKKSSTVEVNWFLGVCF